MSDQKQADNTTIHKTIPASPAMSPGTFKAIAEVISVTKMQDSINQREFYKANILIHAVTGRGTALIEMVSADDTINCSWPTYHASDQEPGTNIANKKFIEAVIQERPGRGLTSNTSFIIQSYRFKQ